MKLRELLSGLNVRASGDLDTEILGLAYDSREVSPGYLFFAIRGARANGNRYVPQAVVKGAAGVVSSEPHIESLAMPGFKWMTSVPYWPGWRRIFTVIRPEGCTWWV